MLSFWFARRKSLFTICFLVLGSLTVALSGLSACSNALSPETSDGVSATKLATIPPGSLILPGILLVGSYTGYPPQESIDQTNNLPVGFDIDLITAIAQHMNLKIEIVSTDFQSIIDKLLAKNFDVVISAVVITHELERRVGFIPYFIGGESLLVEKGNPAEISGLKDLCGRKVAVRASTLEQKDLMITSDSCKKSGELPVQILVVQDQTNAVQLLLNKTISAIYQDAPVTDALIKQYPGRFEIGGSVINGNLEGIAISKDNSGVFNAIQIAFDTVKVDGTYCALIKKWGLTSGALVQNNRHIC